MKKKKLNSCSINQQNTRIQQCIIQNITCPSDIAFGVQNQIPINYKRFFLPKIVITKSIVAQACPDKWQIFSAYIYSQHHLFLRVFMTFASKPFYVLSYVYPFFRNRKVVEWLFFFFLFSGDFFGC